jgi:hypothetical protein
VLKAAVVSLTLCAATAAAAHPCETLTPAEAAERLERLQRDIERNRRHMKIWNATWFSIYGAATAAQTTLAIALDDDDDKAVYGVGAGRAAIAALAVPILSVETRALSTTTGSACADLAAAERVMAENVKLHAKGRGWFKHAGVVGLNLAAFLTLGLGFDLWERGAIGFGIGVVVGEIQIYTQPMSRDIARDYERRGPGRGDVAIVPTLSRDGAGLAIGGAF